MTDKIILRLKNRKTLKEKRFSFLPTHIAHICKLHRLTQNPKFAKECNFCQRTYKTDVCSINLILIFKSFILWNQQIVF
jgi:hypothetical protein